MGSESITLPVVKQITEVARRKDPEALFAIMDDISVAAQSTGMTPQLLQQILDED
jgi:hypothetical protein